MINSVNLNRAYNVKAYEHEGSIYYNLEDPNRFYYTMDGDWYQNGTMTISDADSALGGWGGGGWVRGTMPGREVGGAHV